MKQSLLFKLIIVLLYFVPVDCGAGTGLLVQFPPDNAFVENELVSIVLKLEKGFFDAIRVVGVEGKEGEAKDIQVDSASSRACFTISLNLGLNSIEMLGMRKGSVVERIGVKLFLRSDLFPTFRQPPANFQRFYFHTLDKEQNCADCHDMEPTLSSLRPATPQKSPCYTCHAKKNVGVSVHGPAAKWTCFTCHEVLPGQRKYTTPKPDEKVCFPCHNSEIKQWKSKRILHGPTAVGHCTLCHNPHGASWPGLLRMQTTDLCINCHQEKASGAHVIAGFYGKGHPVRGVKDPFNPEREFTCAGCHNPHAGNTQNMLYHDTTNLTTYCTICHKM